MEPEGSFRPDNLELEVRVFVLHVEGEVLDVADLEIGA